MSKRIVEFPQPKAGDLVGPNYWRSLDERAESPEFKAWVEKEFPAGASELDGVNRRHFLKIMGASFGLAGLGLSGCREPRNYTLPYAKQPENLVPGVPIYFATAFPGTRAHQPVIVETHQHRPTKLEGNPSYGLNGTASSKYAQASILDLYDVDRATGHRDASGALIDDAKLGDLLAALAAEATAAQGAGLAFLARPSSSPSRARLVAAIKAKLPEALWAEYEPVAQGTADKAVSRLAGKSLRIRPDFAKAKRVLALDADFLQSGDDWVAAAKAFAAARRVDKPEEVVAKMNRLYAVESTFTLTGAQADHRLRAAASHLPAITALFIAEVLAQTGGDAALADELKTKAGSVKVDAKWITESVADLVAHRGAALIVAGDHLPESVHALVALANERLAAPGNTLTYVESADVAAAGIVDLAAALKAGTVKTLVVLGGNPAYDAPADLGFEQLVAKVRVIRHGYHGVKHDETSALTLAHGGLFLAATHYLEGWSDGRAADGTYVPVQPMIRPLFSGIDELAILAPFAGVTGDAYAIVKETFAAQGGSNFDAWLAEGVLPGSAYKAAALTVATAKVKELVDAADFAAPALSGKNLEVRITPSSHAFDGAYANNGWLAEAPDAMLKTNWENVIAISPKLAKELDVEPKAMLINSTLKSLNRSINQLVDGKLTCRVATLTVGGRTVTGPLFILPGMPDYTVAVQLGFGRRKVGRIGSRVRELEFEDTIVGTGFDAYPLLTSNAPAYVAGVRLALTEASVVVANTQDHWSMEGRDTIREANADDYAAHPDFVKHMGPESHSPAVYGAQKHLSAQEKALTQPRGNSAYEHPAHAVPAPNVAVWQGHEAEFRKPQQWGMSIDLNTCTGCNACVVACQSENNIPIVGRDQTIKGRDMRWIRLDRYFFDGRGKDDTLSIPEDPQVTFMSVACMHCETAPCESVCPANATVHDEEGINTMAYNRCIGTRYCANNCPYKVRRFNFLDYSDKKIGHFYEGPLGSDQKKPELQKMQMNPDVTVRMRGVMEKCTFCIQRISEAKIRTKAEHKGSGDIAVADGVIKTACQQVCPSEAILFGDVSDANSAVSKAKASARDYGVLTFLNTRPRTTYLAKLRNPNPKMPNAPKSPLSKLEYDAKNGHGHAETHGAEAHGAHAAH